MTEFLLPGEKELFFLINGTHSPFMDGVMWLYSGIKTWLPVMLALIFVLVYKKSWREWLPVVVMLICVVLLCDYVSAGIFKPWVARPRPTSFPGILEFVRTLDGNVGGEMSYGFISGHSTQAFGIAAFTSLLIRKPFYTMVSFVWAFIMGYSRIYLGVHFVTDVLAGWVAGMIVALLLFKVYQSIFSTGPGKRFFIPAEYPLRRIRILSFGIVGYILLFTLLSSWIAPLFQ